MDAASGSPHDRGALDETLSTASPTTASPTEPTVFSSTPTPFLELSEQTYTPLSMDVHDMDLDRDGAGEQSGRSGNTNTNGNKHAAGPSASHPQAPEPGDPASFAGHGTIENNSTADSREPNQPSLPPSAAASTHAAEYDLNLTSEIIAHPGSTLPHSPTSFSPDPSAAVFASSRSPPSQAAVAAPRDARLRPGPSSSQQPGRDDDAHASSDFRGSPSPEARHPSRAFLPEAKPTGDATSAAPGTSTATTAATTVLRPKPRRASVAPSAAAAAVAQPAIVRKVSDNSVAIRHPTPDLGALSGAYLGNIAALEATAERLSMTSSIETAIRDAHEQLKRSDSQRSSVLYANSVRGSDAGSSAGGLPPPQRPGLSRQSSILGTTTTARLGGYSSAGYVMSPAHSLSGNSTRLRSSSKASSLGMPALPAAAAAADATEPADGPADADKSSGSPFLSRHGPGKSSVRSIRSGPSALAEIRENEPPLTLTQEALDEADRVAAAHPHLDDEDDRIRAGAHQHIDMDFGGDPFRMDLRSPGEQADPSPFLHDPMGMPSPSRLQIHQPESYAHYGPLDPERPATSESGTTFEQAQNAFGDFDGVHCDPDAVDMPELTNAAAPAPPAPRAPGAPPAAPPPPRPTSYFDPETGQQMLYYPARVPAMLNLPPKLARNARPGVRNKVRSQILSTMPKKSRESRTWLPDPLEGLGASGSPLLGGDGFGELGPTEPARQGDEAEPRRSVALGHIRQVSETGTVVGLGPPEEPVPAQPRHSSDTQSPRPRELADLPPQLRASVFFDLPQEPPKIEVKDGSATATLDSILDASAKAPVSAFVDHAFAGKLGAEVYGREKKPKKKTKSTVSQQARQSVAPESGGPKKRGSFLPLIGGRRNSDSYGSDPRRTLLGAEGDGEGRASSFHAGAPAGSDQGPESLHEHAPGQDAAGTDNRVADGEGEDDDGEEEEEEEEEENVYQGPPTTLLAELQIRKQQQKMRTRPVHKVNPNGLHTTLLELDTVAEVELKARKGKKVNLAWEDPTATAAGAADDEDEDVPLAMLYAAKAAAGTSGVDRSTRDITTLLNEINRPLGLMERWELEENEPLSRRRDRLQGRDPAAELHLDSVHKRMSRLTLNPGGIGARTQSRLMLPLQPPQPVPESIAGEDHAASEAAADPDPPEIEGETLAERRRRLQAETLPRPRPVSTTFSSELLSQFGDRDDEDENTKPADHGRAKHAKTASRGSVDAEPQEEQETLGQRRRRLQAEREAREREMGSGGGGRGGGGLLSPDLPGRSGTPMGLHSNAVAGSRSLVGMPPYPGGPSPHDEANRLSRRLSMADILNAHPREAPQGNLHPLERERLRREAEAARAQQEQERKMAALRAQMPQTLTTPAVGAAKGGYMGGRFNDGQGGGFGRGVGYAVPQQQQQQRLSTHPAGVSGVGGGTVHGAAAPHPYGVGVAAPLYGGGVPSPGGYGINGAYSGFGGVPMSGQPTQGQLDMVERWRQSVMP